MFPIVLVRHVLSDGWLPVLTLALPNFVMEQMKQVDATPGGVGILPTL